MDRRQQQDNLNQVELVKQADINFEGREKYEVDIDRMVNEGLGGGYITDGLENGLIDNEGLESQPKSLYVKKHKTTLYICCHTYG